MYRMIIIINTFSSIREVISIMKSVKIEEDMKLHKYMFASLSFCSLVLGSCQNNDIDDEHHYDNKVFVTSQQVREIC